MVSGGVVSGGTRRSSSVSTSLCCWARYSRRFIGQDFSGRNGSAVSLPELRISISTRVSAASSCLRQESLSPVPRSKSSSERSSGRSPPSSSRTTVSSSSRDLSKVSAGFASFWFSAIGLFLQSAQVPGASRGSRGVGRMLLDAATRRRGERRGDQEIQDLKEHQKITSQPPTWRSLSVSRVPTPRDALWSTPGRRPDESGRGRHECRRHIAHAANVKLFLRGP